MIAAVTPAVPDRANHVRGVLAATLRRRSTIGSRSTLTERRFKRGTTRPNASSAAIYSLDRPSRCRSSRSNRRRTAGRRCFSRSRGRFRRSRVASRFAGRQSEPESIFKRVRRAPSPSDDFDSAVSVRETVFVIAWGFGHRISLNLVQRAAARTGGFRAPTISRQQLNFLLNQPHEP